MVVPDYIAFLRAINLGKNRKFPMADLRKCLGDEGLSDVETYIQTGNVRLRSPLRSTTKVADHLERIFEKDRGFAVRTVVFTPTELHRVYDDAVGLAAPIAGEVRRYVTLLQQPATLEAAAEIEAIELTDEAARVVGRAVHVWIRDGYQNARINNARIERLLGVATTRDLKVITTLASRWA